MKQKIVIMSWLVFNTICLSSILADTNQSTFEDNDKFKTVGSPHVSKDGKWIAYTLSGQIWIIPIEGGEPRAVTTKGSTARKPVWTPDGKALSFLSDRATDHNQVWALKFGRFGEAEQVTKLKRSANSIKWSPQGDKLLFVFKDKKPKNTDPNTPQDPADKTEKAWVIDRLDFKADRADGYITDRLRNHIYIYDIAKEKLTQITSGDYDDSEPSFSPDGKTVAFVSNRSKHPDRNYNTDIWLVSANATDKGQKLTQLTTHRGPDSSPVWSPDGKWIAYTTASDGEYGVAQLAVTLAAGGSTKILTKNLDRRVSEIEFSDDGESIYFIYPDSGSQHLGLIASQGGPIKRLITGPRVVWSYSLGKDNILAANITSADGTGELYNLKDKQLQQLTHVNDDLLAQLKLGQMEKVRFASQDGTEIESFVVKPPDFKQNHKYPTLLSIHGGPVGQYTYGYSFASQFYAAHGYVVVLPNPRGSTGRGEKFCNAIYQGWGIKDYEDVIAAVDHVIELGYADPDRLGVMGYSYGGFMTNVVITRTDRFKAAVSGAGHSLFIANYGHDIYQKWYEWELGPPWKNRQLWEKLSPLNQIHKVTTPTIFLCGQKDWNVPVLNSELMYQSLKRLGVETQLVVYPNSHHGGWKKQFSRDYYQRALAWMDKYMKRESVIPELVESKADNK
ncbi:MAG: alpha/beta hydrolase family protein [Planctomycetota bacterium]|jgi:dipeptidyl aminopeptidase/acylaminoacyl peptidase